MPQLISLTRGQFAIVDDADFDELSKFKWHSKHNPNDDRWDASRVVDGRIVKMQQVIMGKRDGMQIDHINHNSLDNRRQNLRFCTGSQNCQNRRKKRGGKFEYKGVFQNRQGKFTVRIMIEGKRKSIGTFRDLVNAADAYNRAALENYGEFALLNAIKEEKG
jgi:hypothetical protein